MKKKLCGSLLLLAMLLGLLNLPAWASETGSTSVLASGKCGFSNSGEPTNDVTWTLERNVKDGVTTGLLTIRGVGAMYDYSSANSAPWFSYQDKIEKMEVTIQSGVTSVGNNAFWECAKLEKVTLPDGLTKIGDVAFYDCSKLAEISSPNSADLPDSLETIGNNAFGYCALKEVKIPKNVSAIGEGAFFKCSELTKIEADENNTTYSSKDGVLFDKTEGTATASGDAVSFNASTLICYPPNKPEAKYELPVEITTIAPFACYSARNLTEFSASGGKLKEIGERAFAHNIVLKTLVLPSTLTTVKDDAFDACEGLSDDKGNPIEGATVTFEGSRQQWAALKMGSRNNRLTNAKIIFVDMKQDNVLASGECGASGSNASWSLRKLDVEDGGEATKHELVISGAGAMRDYGSEANVPWTKYDDGQGGEAQDLRDKITSVRIEAKLTNVGSYAFYNCDNLTTVTIETSDEAPSQLKTIGAYAFSDCAALAEINLDQIVNTADDGTITGLSAIGNYAFSDCAALEAVKLPQTLETIGKCAFLRSALKSVTIPANIGDIEIGEWAFRWCPNLAEFTMEELKKGAKTYYTAIGNYALADCTALEKVLFTDNLTTIGEYALSGCSKLARVTIPASVSNIGSRAFYNCPAMTGVNVTEGNTSYSSEAVDMLMNSDQTCIFYYPIGRASPSCEIPLSVTSVAPFAFDGATTLADVYYDGSPSQWKKIAIGDHNDPLKNLSDENIHCSGVDNAASAETIISEFNVDKTENGWDAVLRLQCGQYPEGLEDKNPKAAWCATYAEDGRFLGLIAVSDGLTPGEDNELTFTLSNEKKEEESQEPENGEIEQELEGGGEEGQSPIFTISDEASKIFLFIVDGNASPCCAVKSSSLLS